MSEPPSNISARAREAAMAELKDNADWIPGHERPNPYGHHIQSALDAERASSEAALAAVTRERDALEMEAQESARIHSEIVDALEARGYFHNGNGRDIGAIIDDTKADLSTARIQLAALHAVRAQRAESAWLPIETAPRNGKCEKFLVTNNIEARTASGHMSHVWLVSMVHKNGSEYTAFDGFRELSGLTHWRKVL